MSLVDVEERLDSFLSADDADGNSLGMKRGMNALPYCSIIAYTTNGNVFDSFPVTSRS
jgi:hypothetical protein